MEYKRSDEFATKAEAEAYAERIRANADPYRGVYNLNVSQVYGRDTFVVTYYNGSL